MKVKKSEVLGFRLPLFTQLESYNAQVKAKKKSDANEELKANEDIGDVQIAPLEVLRNLAYLQVISDKFKADTLIISKVLGEDKFYMPGTEDEFEPKEGESCSYFPLSKVSEYQEKVNSVLEEEVELDIVTISAKDMKTIAEDGHIDSQSVILLQNLGYIKD